MLFPTVLPMAMCRDDNIAGMPIRLTVRNNTDGAAAIFRGLSIILDLFKRTWALTAVWTTPLLE
jgi:hypothetical protein